MGDRGFRTWGWPARSPLTSRARAAPEDVSQSNRPPLSSHTYHFHSQKKNLAAACSTPSGNGYISTSCASDSNVLVLPCKLQIGRQKCVSETQLGSASRTTSAWIGSALAVFCMSSYVTWARSGLRGPSSGAQTQSKTRYEIELHQGIAILIAMKIALLSSRLLRINTSYC